MIKGATLVKILQGCTLYHAFQHFARFLILFIYPKKILQEKHQKGENREKKRGILHLEELIVHSSCQS